MKNSKEVGKGRSSNRKWMIVEDCCSTEGQKWLTGAKPNHKANLWIILSPLNFFSRCIQGFIFIGLYDRNTCLFVFPGPFIRKEEAVRGLVTEVEQKYGEITGKEKNLRVMTHDSCVL